MMKYFLLAGISFSCLAQHEADYARAMESLLSGLQRHLLEPQDFEKKREQIFLQMENSKQDCEESNGRMPASFTEVEFIEKENTGLVAE